MGPSFRSRSSVLVMYFSFNSLSVFSIRIYFIRISRLTFAKFYEYSKSSAEADSFKRTQFRLLTICRVSTIYVFHVSVENYSFH